MGNSANDSGRCNYSFLMETQRRFSSISGTITCCLLPYRFYGFLPELQKGEKKKEYIYKTKNAVVGTTAFSKVFVVADEVKVFYCSNSTKLFYAQIDVFISGLI